MRNKCTFATREIRIRTRYEISNSKTFPSFSLAIHVHNNNNYKAVRPRFSAVYALCSVTCRIYSRRAKCTFCTCSRTQPAATSPSTYICGSDLELFSEWNLDDHIIIIVCVCVCGAIVALWNRRLLSIRKLCFFYQTILCIFRWFFFQSYVHTYVCTSGERAAALHRFALSSERLVWDVVGRN